MDKAIVQLTISAAFFACHSCEYLKVPCQDMKRMKLLCLQNIRFFKDEHLLSAPLDCLEWANSVAVTFKMQKHDSKHDTVITEIQMTLHSAPFCNGHTLLIGFGHIQAQQRTHRSAWFGTTTDWNRFLHTKFLQRYTSASIGSAHLGFAPKEIRTHSLQLGAAIEMYLAGGYQCIPSC